MSIVDAAGNITQLSVTQVTNADHKQEGGCMRRWWFEVPNGLKPEQTYARNEGTAGHELFRRYFLSGESPKGRTLMGKAVTGAILKGDLPTPGPDMLVERRFSGQEMRDYERCECGHGAELHDREGCRDRPLLGDSGPECNCEEFRPAWIPLDRAETLELAGVKWDGSIDLFFRRGARPSVWDHKFSSDIGLYAKKPSELIQTVQMPVLVYSQMPYEPDALEWEIVHNYVSKKGVESSIRRAVVTRDQVLERIADVIGVVERMKVAAKAKDQNDVPANTSNGAAACHAWSGCPHQSICSAFKKYQSRSTTPATGATPMALTDAEAAIFADIPMDDAPAAPPADEVAPDADTADAPELAAAESAEVAELRAKLEAAQKKQAEQSAKKDRPKMKMVDENGNDVTRGAQPPAPAASTKPTESPTPCKCGEKITSENGSLLQDGKTWKHVGCKLDAPPAPPPRQRAPAKAKTEAPPPPTPAFRGEKASDQAATAALDAMKEQAKAKETENYEATRKLVDPPVQKAEPAEPVATTQRALDVPRHEALARLFDACASLLRSP